MTSAQYGELVTEHQELRSRRGRPLHPVGLRTRPGASPDPWSRTLSVGSPATPIEDPRDTPPSRWATCYRRGLDSLLFVNSGSEAVEAAMRLARHITGARNAPSPVMNPDCGRPALRADGGTGSPGWRPAVELEGSCWVCWPTCHARTAGASPKRGCGRETRHRRLPRVVPRPDVRRRSPDHVGHEVPSRDRAAPIALRVAVSPFPVAYRYGWDVETATDFALARWSTASSPCYLDADPDHTLAGRCVASAAITATSSAMITRDQIG